MRRVMVVTATSLLTLGVGACGSDKDETPAPTTPGAEISTTVPDADDAPPATLINQDQEGGGGGEDEGGGGEDQVDGGGDEDLGVNGLPEP